MMDDARLTELVEAATGGSDDAALRERVKLAVLMAHKVGRWQMREDAARASIINRRYKPSKRIMDLAI